MEFAIIPETSLRISRVGLGTWAIGGWMWGGTDDEESIKTIHAAVERGLNLIDTAPAYGFGRSEEIVGQAIADGGCARVVIATKVGLEWKDGKVFRNASRDRILREATDSLRRLRTDYIDVYQVHWPDPLVPIEETAEAMQTLFDQGKIRAIGVSNFSVAQIERFRRVAKLHVVQPPYNLFEREIEAELLPYCRKSGLATLTYGALCRGLLSGKLQEDAHFLGDDLRLSDPKFQPPRYAQYLAAVRRLDQFARQRYGKAGYPLGGALGPRPRSDVGIVGGASPRPVAADRRGFRLVLGPGRKGGDRTDPARVGHRSGGSGIHGAAAAAQARGLRPVS